MLYTNLKHIETAIDYHKVIGENKNIVMVCGRMDPLSVQSYHIAETLMKDYKNVAFFDIECDNPEFKDIFDLAPWKNTGTPFIAFYMDGKLINVITDSLTKAQMREFLDSHFGSMLKAPKETLFLSK